MSIEVLGDEAALVGGPWYAKSLALQRISPAQTLAARSSARGVAVAGCTRTGIANDAVRPLNRWHATAVPAKRRFGDFEERGVSMVRVSLRDTTMSIGANH